MANNSILNMEGMVLKMPDKNRRIDIIDAVRGVAIIAMVIYHGMYDITDIFGYSLPVFDFFSAFEPWFAGVFILLSGISSRFSHSNLKRGVRVLGFGFLLTLVTVLFMPSQAIYFGILHFIGSAILIFALIRPVFDKIPPVVSYAVLAFLFVATYSMSRTYFVGVEGVFGFSLPVELINIPWLFPLGIPDVYFYSADYFPLLPWLFLFLIGTVAGIPVKEHKLPEKFYSTRVPFFACAGRHTLFIYLVHQPIIYGLLYIILVFFKI